MFPSPGQASYGSRMRASEMTAMMPSGPVPKASVVRNGRRRGAAAVVGMLSLLAVAHGSVPSPVAEASSGVISGTDGRTGSVSPGVNLTNEVVTVSWSGFRPTTQANVYTVIVLQCRANPTTLDDCHTADPFPMLANGNRLLDSSAADGQRRKKEVRSREGRGRWVPFAH